MTSDRVCLLGGARSRETIPRDGKGHVGIEDLYADELDEAKEVGVGDSIEDDEATVRGPVVDD